MRHKKASLNISVEAIIILILAITMLGLGMGFIKGMFGKVSTQLEQQVANEPEPSAATTTNPLTVSRETIVANPGSEEVLKLNVYNNKGINLVGEPNINCGSALLIAEPDANTKTISPRSKETMVMIFTVPIGAQQGKKYLCSAEFVDGSDVVIFQKDVTLSVV